MHSKFFLLILVILSLTLVTAFVSCGDDDDDDDDDAVADDDDAVDDDDATDDDAADDDDDATDICLEGVVIDPSPDPGMTPDSACTSCHSDAGISSVAHNGQHDDGAPDTCMTSGCHGCP